MSAFLIVAGLIGLFVGGELLVRFASQLAQRLGVSSLVIGLTGVAFGTSAPELAASLTAALRGSSEIALGNVIGSNTANIGLILGLSALVTPLTTGARFLRRELPFMVLTGAALVPLLLDGRLSRLEGAGLVGALLVYLLALFRISSAPDDAPAEPTPANLLLVSLVGITGGLVLLVGGAQALVAGAVTVATTLGVPETVIGLTLVAVGTSLPELASSLAAARKGEMDLVLGNVVDSNIFNVLAILSVSSLVQPLAVPFAELNVNLWIMLGFTLLTAPFLATRLTLNRWEGALLLGLYGGYTVWLLA